MAIEWSRNMFVLTSAKMIAVPETNIAPEHMPSQEETSIPTIHFPVLC